VIKMCFVPADPGSVVFTMTISMTLKEWNELQEQLDRDEPALFTPAGRLSSEVTKMSLQAHEYWWKHIEEGV
jgi:hypothetical protein